MLPKILTTRPARFPGRSALNVSTLPLFLAVRVTRMMDAMTLSTYESRRQVETFDGDQLAAHQLARFNSLLDRILPENRFYAEKLAGVRLPLKSLDELAELPMTYKDQLVAAEHEGSFAANLTWPVHEYVRFHQTSGTKGRPLVCLDTAEDWQWWIECWQHVLDAAHVSGPKTP